MVIFLDGILYLLLRERVLDFERGRPLLFPDLREALRLTFLGFERVLVRVLERERGRERERERDLVRDFLGIFIKLTIFFLKHR